MKRIYGRRPVEEFFRSHPDPSVVKHIYVSPSLPKKYMGILLPFMKGMRDRLEEKPRTDLDKICDGNHQGIIIEVTDRAAKQQSSAADGLQRPDPGGSLREALDNHPGLYVLTDRLQDAQNLGSLIRSAEALGAMALIVTGKGVRPGEVSDRISAGGSHHLPVFSMSNPDGALRDATDRDYWIIAAAGRPDDQSEPLVHGATEFENDYVREIDIGAESEHLRAEFNRIPRSSRSKHSEGPVYLWTHESEALPENGRFILMIGHEGEGLKPSLISRSDYVISIPVHGRLNSLNAAVAGAVLIERILSVRPRPQYD